MARRGWDRGRNGGAALIGGLGLVLLAFYFGYLAANRYYLEGPVWLFPVGLVIMLVLSLGLVYGGYWLASGSYPPEMVWEVAFWCFAGVIGALSMTFWPIFYQRVVGVAIEDPLFILFVSAGLGADAGLLIGIHDMRSRRRIQQVERARDSLGFLNRLLRHNVLNALTVIDGYAGMLADDLEGVPGERARTIQERSREITALVENTRVLVDRIDDDRPLRPVDLSGMVEDELEDARDEYAEADIEGNLEPGVEVCADDLLSTAIENLLENAIEHNDGDRPRVDVSLATRDGTAVLLVADDGPGIPDARKEEAFDPGPHGDYGIGLYLVRSLIEDYGGEIEIVDNDPRGTIVRVELPRVEG